MMRPEARALLTRWREVAGAAVLAALGLWTAAQGGLFLLPLGFVITAAGLGWALYALRRLRFGQQVAAPGLVEVREGQITYFGPTAGGVIALPELVELHLVVRPGAREWRLREQNGTSLAIPVQAAGAEALFDAFLSLPGLDSAALVAAVDPPAARSATLPVTLSLRRIWTRPGVGLIAREPSHPARA